MANQRVLTATAIVVVLLACVFAPWQWPFTAFVVLVLGVGSWEWSRLIGLSSQIQRTAYVALNFLLLLGASQIYEELAQQVQKLSFFAFWFWLLLVPLVIRYPKTAGFFRKPVLTAAAGTVVLLSSSTGLLWLRMQPEGQWLVLLLIGIVAVADTGAYYVGRRLGKHKLAVGVSPGKTFEGVYGGLIANFCLGVVLSVFLQLSVEQSFVLFITIFATDMLSVVGDLVESALKRSCGVKDSGNSLPGHGGVLDRIDGLIAATPCFVLGVSFLQVML